jgi:hypothetical protein
VKLRSVYRSRLFWLGLPGLVFLLWAWWVAKGNMSLVGFSGPHDWVIGQLGGEVIALWDFAGWPTLRDFATSHGKMSLDEAGREMGAMIEWRREKPTRRLVFIPYLWVVLTYTAVWLLTLALWQRRKSRLLKLHAAP